jgi:hypothetical protein
MDKFPLELIINIIKFDKKKFKYLLLNKFFCKITIKYIWNDLILKENDKNIFKTIVNQIFHKEKIQYFNNFIYKNPIFNYLKYITNINDNIILILITKNINPKKINMIIPLTLKITKKLILESEKINYIHIKLHKNINNEILNIIKKKLK